MRLNVPVRDLVSSAPISDKDVYFKEVWFVGSAFYCPNTLPLSFGSLDNQLP